MNMKINDVTLRDGNHAVSHSIDLRLIEKYCKTIDTAGLYSVEVGHGNGLGASSLQVGLCSEKDADMLTVARTNLKHTKLCVHSIPSFATINKNLNVAIDIGVDIFRIGTHCTEADVTERHINYLKDKGKEVYGALMMIHMTDFDTILGECKKIESYGADGVILMDSVGHFTSEEVSALIMKLKEGLSIEIGFHAHNNLGMAITNSTDALKCGAGLLDASAFGLGAGAGNAQLEVLLAVLNKQGYSYSLKPVVECANIVRAKFPNDMPRIDESSLYSGLYGVFSGFKKHVQRIALQYNLNEHDIWFELGKNNVIAGQEDLIVDIALKLKSKYLLNE
jgi:4-hydroxy 2-oxovalerate aldolase